MENKDINYSEVNEIKRRYKKLRNIIVFIVLVLLCIYLVDFIKDIVILDKIFENNVDVDCGDNYKMIVTQDDDVNVNYFKGNRSKHVAGDHGQNIMMWDGDVAYLVIKDEKEYIEYTGDDIPMKYMGGRTTVTFFPTLALQKEDVDSLMDVIREKIIFRLNVGTEKLDGEEYYVIDVHSDIKMWISKENYRCIKEISYGQVKKVEVIKDVVTDEEMKTPVELGYTKRELSN